MNVSRIAGGIAGLGLAICLAACSSGEDAAVTAYQAPPAPAPAATPAPLATTPGKTFDATQLAAFIPGKSISFGKGTATYGTDHVYAFRASGRVYKGVWSLDGDRVCFKLSEYYSRCERYGYDGGKYFQIDQMGFRTEVYNIE